METLMLLTLATLFMVVFVWGFRQLPGEKWQILAAVPLHKGETGSWQGLNLTYYGLFVSAAYVMAVAVLLVLLGSIGVPVAGTAALVLLILAAATPAARLVARIVEKKQHTFSVGGASFIGMLLAPGLILLVDRTLGAWGGFELPVAATLAAMLIAYAFGEGFGRLACISFGCCYGKPLHLLPPFWQRLLRPITFTFSGATKKIAYAGRLEGEPVLPVQAMTCLLNTGAGLAGTVLFLQGRYRGALLLTLTASQLWRLASEFLRADYRGGGRLSAYQWMSLAAVCYLGAVAVLLPEVPPLTPHLHSGFLSLWQPGMILLLQALWSAIFLYTGRSTVTGSRLTFHVRA
ncbi:MAG: prolipoprotein diacylglyceryl transferase, partial [Desulfobacteraceae bacterium]|nr:prolipoprotein diacylglyceryl transferase [Desulfobacteraceae bacterium]